MVFDSKKATYQILIPHYLLINLIISDTGPFQKMFFYVHLRYVSIKFYYWENNFHTLKYNRFYDILSFFQVLDQNKCGHLTKDELIKYMTEEGKYICSKISHTFENVMPDLYLGHDHVTIYNTRDLQMETLD